MPNNHGSGDTMTYPARRAIALAVIIMFTLSGCSTCKYISDTAKGASGIAHETEERKLEDDVSWNPKTQEKDGRRIKETGTLSYGCKTYVTPHLIIANKHPIVTTMPHITCKHSKIPYQLTYDIQGNIIEFTKEPQ